MQRGLHVGQVLVEVKTVQGQRSMNLTLIRLGYFGSWKNWGGGGPNKAPP